MAEMLSKTAWARLLRRVARKTKNNCDAEDFLNSAYVRLNEYQTKRVVANKTAFLVRTALNISIDNYRHDRLASEDISLFDFQDTSPLQDEVLAARVRLKRVREGLAKLSPQTRKVLFMRRLEGKSYDEIAMELGVSRSTVERIVARATAFLLEWTKDW